MALTDTGMPCSLCREPIDDPERNTFSTTAHAQLHGHSQFGMMNDVVVHQHCIDDWELRDAFIEHYNTSICDELIVDAAGCVRYRGSFLSEIWRWLTGFLR